MLHLVAQALQTDCIATKLWAIGTLGRMGHLAKSAAPALRAVLRDRDKRIRQLARWALDQVEPIEAADSKPLRHSRRAA
jgi:hypothetical protein